MRQMVLTRFAATGVAALLMGGMAFAQNFTSSQYCDPWCAQGWGGTLDCSYRNFQQCLVSTRGLGGHCYENPFLSQCQRPVEPSPLRRRHAR
jgi:hypothetical protein